MKEITRRIDTASAKNLFDRVIAMPDRGDRLRLLDDFNARELGLNNRSLDSAWNAGPAAPPGPQP
jgi:hypothetical protein